MKDLIRFDQCKEELSLTKESNDNLRKLNEKLSIFNGDLQTQKRQLEFRWQETLKAGEIVEKNNQKTIQELNERIKKERRSSNLKVFGYGIGGALVGIAAGMLFF